MHGECCNRCSATGDVRTDAAMAIGVLITCAEKCGDTLCASLSKVSMHLACMMWTQANVAYCFVCVCVFTIALHRRMEAQMETDTKVPMCGAVA